MNHLQLAFRNLRRRPTRSILTVFGVALAVGSFITLYGLSNSVQENVQQSFDEHGADLTVRRSGVAEPFGGTLRQTLIPEVSAIPGVEAVSGQLITFAATDNNDSVLATGWAPDSFYWKGVPLVEGRIPERGESKAALIGQEIARSLGKNVGDDITLLGEKFRRRHQQLHLYHQPQPRDRQPRRSPGHHVPQGRPDISIDQVGQSGK